MTRVLVDTSVWIDHFRHRNETLITLLHQDRVLVHPMVVGELACGTPPAPRTQTLRDLGLLPKVELASMEEAMAFIERAAVFGLGCGLVDIILLTSTLMTTGAALWTLDERLADLADRFDIAHQVAMH